MSLDVEVKKGGRPVRSLEDEIAAQKEKLRKLEDRHKEQVRKERERNQKAVYALLVAEKLDGIAAEIWEAVLPAIKDVLHKQEQKSGGSVAVAG